MITPVPTYERGTGVPYGIRSRDYLVRALARLSSGSDEALFYAAFELRCGIEARIQEYLEGSKVATKKIKQGWSIAQLSKAGEKAYLNGPRIQRLAQERAGRVSAVLYYTPVGEALSLNGKKLGNYLHALQTSPNQKDGWWDAFRTLLSDTADRLVVANTGTLLGPALLKRGTKEISVLVELPDSIGSGDLMSAIGNEGDEVVMSVSYLDSLPDPIEPEAHVWSVGGGN